MNEIAKIISETYPDGKEEAIRRTKELMKNEGFGKLGELYAPSIISMYFSAMEAEEDECHHSPLRPSGKRLAP